MVKHTRPTVFFTWLVLGFPDALELHCSCGAQWVYEYDEFPRVNARMASHTTAALEGRVPEHLPPEPDSAQPGHTG